MTAALSNGDLDRIAIAQDTAREAQKDEKGKRGPTQAEILISIAEGYDLYASHDGVAYADVISGHARVTLPVRRKAFRQVLQKAFYKKTGGAPNADALQSAIGVIEARALFEGETRQVAVRVAATDDSIWIDLANDEWNAIEITAKGWRVTRPQSVRFHRPNGMLPLPSPFRGGTIDDLRGFLNVPDDSAFVLTVTWLLAAMSGRGPYPPLVVNGEQGSAKSTFCSTLRSLIDPNTANLRALPRDERDLFIAATNAHVLSFDNVSSISPWLSDALCRLATGGGFSVRALYTDGDEIIFDAKRPMILNGISDMISRPDLGDRCLFLTLDPIPDDKRRSEHELRDALGRTVPHILGVLCDALAHGMKMLSKVSTADLPRMADFALWGRACEGALWKPGTFDDAYIGNRRDVVSIVIDGDPVAEAIRALVAVDKIWSGTATELHGLLSGRNPTAAAGRSWPVNGQTLSSDLTRIAPNLRKIGILIERGKGRQRREIKISGSEQAGKSPSHASRSVTGDAGDAGDALKQDFSEGIEGFALISAEGGAQ